MIVRHKFWLSRTTGRAFFLTLQWALVSGFNNRRRHVEQKAVVYMRYFSILNTNIQSIFTTFIDFYSYFDETKFLWVARESTCVTMLLISGYGQSGYQLLNCVMFLYSIVALSVSMSYD